MSIAATLQKAMVSSLPKAEVPYAFLSDSWLISLSCRLPQRFNQCGTCNQCGRQRQVWPGSSPHWLCQACASIRGKRELLSKFRGSRLDTTAVSLPPPLHWASLYPAGPMWAQSPSMSSWPSDFQGIFLILCPKTIPLFLQQLSLQSPPLEALLGLSSGPYLVLTMLTPLSPALPPSDL